MDNTYTWDEVPEDVKQLIAGDCPDKPMIYQIDIANRVMALIDKAYKEGEQAGFEGGVNYGQDMHYHQWMREINGINL